MKKVIASSDSITKLQDIVNEIYPGYEIVSRGIVSIDYLDRDEYKYSQVFTIQLPKENPQN